jgi:hypothetical protein
MALPANIQPLLDKEMSRKDFLLTLALGVASVIGFSSIIHIFTGKSVDSHLEQRFSQASNSKSSSYGGNKA